MVGPRVLLDTNVIISCLVFTTGNEHKILRLVEDGKVSLVLPEPIMIEAHQILERKFSGLEGLLNVFLEEIKFEHLSLDIILANCPKYYDVVRDKKDLAIFASVAMARPEYFITGNRALKIDLLNEGEIAQDVKILSGKEFLSDWGKHSDRA